MRLEPDVLPMIRKLAKGLPFDMMVNGCFCLCCEDGVITALGVGAARAAMLVNRFEQELRTGIKVGAMVAFP